LSAEFYAVQWIIAFFAYDLSTEIVGRVIDLFLVNGWKMIYKVILSLLWGLQNEVKDMKHDEFVDYLKNFTKNENLDEVV